MKPEQQREILEAAAKACGIELEEDGHFWDMSQDPAVLRPWNPLINDGDALRLAVKLYFVIKLEGDCVYAIGCEVQNYQLFEWNKNDPYAATRRAIVRAAAEIGKQMK